MSSMVLGSPRARRRLAWFGGFATVAAAVGIGLALVPEHDGKQPPGKLRAGAVLPERQVALRAADRRAIDRSLDRFVVEAVTKRNPTRARGVLAPGVDPRGVYSYPARGTSFHDWTLNESTPGHVSLDLMLQPTVRAAASTGPIVFTIRMRRSAGRWLVESLVPTAMFSSKTHKVTAAVDFNPGLGRDPPKAAPLTKSTLGAGWIALPLGILGLVLAFPIGFLLVKWIRGRLAFRRYRRENAGASLPWKWRDETA
jgi:hypothetical protein